MFASGINVPTYTLIAREFKEEHRTTANSFDSAGYYIGGGISSLFVVIIQQYGWRVMYQLAGTGSLLVGIAALLFVKDKKPVKSSVPVPKTEEKQNIFSSLTKGIKLIWKNPTARWVTIG